MKIRTLPVYSKLAKLDDVPPEVVAQQPEGWRLSQHQVETYKALTQGDADVIFNTAMTGDGKSLAGQLSMLVHGGKSGSLMAMYPTNELIEDQKGQLAGSKRSWQAGVQFDLLNSAALDEIMAEDIYSQRGDALLDTLRNHDVVLTNPDVFHLMLHQFYVRRGKQGDAPDKVFGPLLQRFSQFTFDEFHIFETAQVVSVLNALLLIHETQSLSRRHKFLFLSATPGEVMNDYLDRSGLQVQPITGCYAHSEAILPSDSWRRILHGATTHIESGRVEAWVEEHLEDTLLPFFEARGPHAKGAIIVNSVAAAYRLLARLQPAFAAHGLTVEPNTGLTSRARRKVSYVADLLIGTSTVDVGVDFQINFLLFESRDAGSFLQRLGRLGRHDGYERDGQKHIFQDFVAYALVPEWIHETLFKGRDGATALLEDGAVLDRETFNQAIDRAYPPTAKFERYAQTWGKYQSVHILRGLSSPTIKEQYAKSREALGQRYEATFKVKLRPAFGDYQTMCKEQKPLWDEVVSFRGGSYFNCGILDYTEDEQGVPKTADLLQVIANAELLPIDEGIFYTAVERAGLSKRHFEYQKPLAFFQLRQWRAERENYSFILDEDIAYWSAERFDQALLLSRWRLDGQIPGLHTINKHLSHRKLPCLLCKGAHPLKLKRQLRLPLLFALHTFRSLDGIEGTVAFGREALLLHTRLHFGGLKRDTGAVFC